MQCCSAFVSASRGVSLLLPKTRLSCLLKGSAPSPSFPRGVLLLPPDQDVLVEEPAIDHLLDVELQLVYVRDINAVMLV